MPDYRQRSEARERKRLRQERHYKRLAGMARSDRAREKRQQQQVTGRWAMVVLMLLLLIGLAVALHWL